MPENMVSQKQPFATKSIANTCTVGSTDMTVLDYLIYNAPLEYADLILNGDPETYLKTVTEYKHLDS